MSMALDMGRHDMTDLSNRDFLLAGGFHLLVLILLVLFGAWHSSPPPEPQSVEVHLISRAQLEKALHQRPPAHREPHRKPAPKHHTPPPAPKPAPQHKSHALPPLKQKPAAKPRPTPKQRPAPKKKEVPFDPFKPLVSTSDRDTPTSSPSQASTQNENMVPQLSAKEMNHYIAMIISAIEQNWKVPVVSGDVHDPRVEMTLNPDGSVQGVKVIESSGSEAVDASAVRAIQAAGPFTIPSRHYAQFRTMRFHLHLLR